jgi:hypothetical protein
VAILTVWILRFERNLNAEGVVGVVKGGQSQI